MFDDDVQTLFGGNASHFLGNRLLIMIDHVIGAQLPGPLHLVLVSRSGNDGGVEQLGNLNRGDPDA